MAYRKRRFLSKPAYRKPTYAEFCDMQDALRQDREPAQRIPAWWDEASYARYQGTYQCIEDARADAYPVPSEAEMAAFEAERAAATTSATVDDIGF